MNTLCYLWDFAASPHSNAFSPLNSEYGFEPLLNTFERSNKRTENSQLKGHIGHANHILRDAGESETVVVPAHVDQRQVDGVNVGPVDVRLEGRHKTLRLGGK